MSAVIETEIGQVHERTGCCIVGGGPAGMILSFLMARQGIDVQLLELHTDFDRDFRGDTLLPSTMECLDDLGLAHRILELPHARIDTISLMVDGDPQRIVDFRRLRTRFPYMVVLPQMHLLEFVAAEAIRFKNFKLLRGANVFELLSSNGTITGVRYRAHDGIHNVHAQIVVGADGRFSRVRRLAGLKSQSTAASLELLWFRLPRDENDSEGVLRGAAHSVMILPVRANHRNHFLILLDCAEYWQIGYVGDYTAIRSAGLSAFQDMIAHAVPAFEGRVRHLRDWRQISKLTVQPSRLEQWYRPGLLLIGDAAHVMSPLGGVGVNYAIQDAVIASKVLSQELKLGYVSNSSLAAVQRRRQWPTRCIQQLQALEQRLIIGRAMNSKDVFKLPTTLRLLLGNPIIQKLLANIIAFGFRRVRVN
jgi:2-polyprenyl-6-methoxyphenol hydroxylase-like FAD-dependent oxidoreductase